MKNSKSYQEIGGVNMSGSAEPLGVYFIVTEFEEILIKKFVGDKDLV